MNVFYPQTATSSILKVRFEKYRRHAIRAARDLYYDYKVIEELKNAKTEGQIIKIMSEARKRSFT